MYLLKLIVGIVVGGVLGIAAGWLFAAGLGVYSQWQNPTDPSAGSVAIVGIFTIPIGLFFGGTIGAICGVRWM